MSEPAGRLDAPAAAHSILASAAHRKCPRSALADPRNGTEITSRVREGMLCDRENSLPRSGVGAALSPLGGTTTSIREVIPVPFLRGCRRRVFARNPYPVVGEAHVSARVDRQARHVTINTSLRRRLGADDDTTKRLGLRLGHPGTATVTVKTDRIKRATVSGRPRMGIVARDATELAVALNEALRQTEPDRLESCQHRIPAPDLLGPGPVGMPVALAAEPHQLIGRVPLGTEGEHELLFWGVPTRSGDVPPGPARDSARTTRWESSSLHRSAGHPGEQAASCGTRSTSW